LTLFKDMATHGRVTMPHGSKEKVFVLSHPRPAVFEGELGAVVARIVLAQVGQAEALLT